MDMGQQQLFKKTLSNHLDEVMGLLEGQFDKTFLALWPGFHYKRRAVHFEPEELVKLMHAYQVDRKVAKPTVTSPRVIMTPNRKLSSESALSYSKFNVSNEVKMFFNPAKVLENLKGHADPGNFDNPQPEVEVIDDPGDLVHPQPSTEVKFSINPGHAPEKGDILKDVASVEQLDEPQLEKPQPHEEIQSQRQSKSQSPHEKSKSQSQHEQPEESEEEEWTQRKPKPQSQHEQSKPQSQSQSQSQSSEEQPEALTLAKIRSRKRAVSSSSSESEEEEWIERKIPRKAQSRKSSLSSAEEVEMIDTSSKKPPMPSIEEKADETDSDEADGSGSKKEEQVVEDGPKAGDDDLILDDSSDA
jgi:hypothetical protein